MTRSIPTVRILLISAGVPLLVVAVALGIMLAWLPELPATIATHWSGAGPDGYAPRGTAPVLLAVFGVGLPLLLTGILLVGLHRVFGVVQKFLAAVSAGLGVMMAVVFLALVGIQRGLDDAHRAGDVGPWVLLGTGLGVVVGVGAWFALPRASRMRVDGSSGELDPASPLPLVPGERTVWVGSARYVAWAIGLQIVLAAGVLVVVIIVAAMTGGAAWFLILVPVVIALSVVSTLEWRVRVDDSGLHVRGLLGLPRWDIAQADIAEAGTVDVAPVADFGGWGLRWWGSRTGVITRGGTALEVRRRSGASLTVTVDDAATAAQLLSAGITRPSQRPR